MVLEIQTKILIRGVNPYVVVTSDQADTLQPGWRRPLPVLVQVNGLPAEPWHVNMMPAGDGSFYLYLHETVRKVSGTKVGDVVVIRAWFDEEYQNGPQHHLPALFANALSENPHAKANWQSLPPSRQKEVLRYMAGLKSEAALERNIVAALQVLSGEPGHYLGRDWNDGR